MGASHAAGRFFFELRALRIITPTINPPDFYSHKTKAAYLISAVYAAVCSSYSPVEPIAQSVYPLTRNRSQTPYALEQTTYTLNRNLNHAT